MVKEKPNGSDQQRQFGRRTVLQAAAAATTVFGMSLAIATQSDDRNGFPPGGITTYGDKIELGNGSARPFTTETSSETPKYHGVEIDRAALDGLPDADALEDSDGKNYTDRYGSTGEAVEVHRKWSLEFFVEFPDAAQTPFTFLGLNWNPNGHAGGGGAWERPHFDIHFHMLGTDTIDAIDGPELPGKPDAFTNTLIQGFVGMGRSEQRPELAFVEPMVTRKFLHEVSGTESDEIAQPAVYPHNQYHPTEYSVRNIPSKDAIAVAIQAFEEV